MGAGVMAHERWSIIDRQLSMGEAISETGG